MPYPRVMNPTMLSPGMGVQHLANLTRQLSSPSTMTPVSPMALGFLDGCFGASLPLAVETRHLFLDLDDDA